jgi:hypothetical protein
MNRQEHRPKALVGQWSDHKPLVVATILITIMDPRIDARDRHFVHSILSHLLCYPRMI